jgi:basic membrane lipoprotein Med (substrate-binding protein (PBP1-ABC) superfamily)
MSWLRKRWYFVAFGAVVLGAVATWILWPSPKPEEQPRARQYLEFTACLLTDDQGITGPTGQPVWAAMQDASLATLAKVQYLSVAGPQTESNALPFANTLAQRHCDLIFAAGSAPAAAVRTAANSFPAVRFYVVTADAPAAGAANPSNVRAVRTQDVASVIKDAVSSR